MRRQGCLSTGFAAPHDGHARHQYENAGIIHGSLHIVKRALQLLLCDQAGLDAAWSCLFNAPLQKRTIFSARDGGLMDFDIRVRESCAADQMKKIAAK